MRVEVYGGDGATYLGQGEYVGDVAVYIIRGDESIYSAKNAEEIPEGVDIAEMLPSNPKIVMDTGEVVYGCQVWWHPAEVKSE